jgi:hypothetical protein
VNELTESNDCGLNHIAIEYYYGRRGGFDPMGLVAKVSGGYTF